MSDRSGANRRLSFNTVFRALRSRNYRLFFMGQGISLIGTWIQSVALGWLVYRLTGSALLLGVVSFSAQIPTFILSPFAGVLVDRWNRHRILIATQTLFMFQALALASLVLAGIIQVWEILVLSVFQGLISGFDVPTRQAFVVEMIEDRDDLSNAIALNSSMFNGARLVGPAIAGMLIALLGEGMCFLINGLSYIAVILALLAMRVTPQMVEVIQLNVLQELKLGAGYTFGFAPIRSTILLLGLVSLVAMPYSVLMPVFATVQLRGNATTLGFLTAATGVGALVGATWLASRPSVLGLGKWIPLGAGIMGAALIGFSLSKMLWLSLIMLSITGFAMITQMASSNTILQTVVEDRMRGRVMSFYTMAFAGMAPFGSLLAGSLAHSIGAPHTVLIGGAVAIAGGLIFAIHLPRLRALVRPVYCERGILPPTICGVENVAELTVPPEQR